MYLFIHHLYNIIYVSLNLHHFLSLHLSVFIYHLTIQQNSLEITYGGTQMGPMLNSTNAVYQYIKNGYWHSDHSIEDCP